MSLESFKKQAGRLVAYLGEHHKLRLKHSSALEAIAATHGARNWATLQAKSALPDTAEAAPSAGRGLAARGGGMPLVWQDGVPKLFVSQADWSRHTLAEGVPYYTLAWLEEHLLNCKRTFAGGVFINVVEGGRLPLIVDLHRDGEEAAVPEYNLLAGLSADEVCDVLMQAYPAQPRSAVKDHIRSLCGLALKRLLPKEMPPHESLSLSTILLALRPAALRYHMVQDPQLAEELRGLAQVSSNGSEDEEHLMWALDSAFGPLTRELLRLKDGEYGPALFSRKSFAQGSRSVVDCFARGDLLHVTLPDDDRDSSLRAMWMEVMQQAIRRRASIGGARDKQVVLGIGRCKYFAGPALESFATQGRGQNLVLLLSTGSELELSRMPVGQRILANTQNRLRLGPPTAEEIDQVLRELEQSTARLRSAAGTSFA
jgi:hypothetical protein